ncbi:MAG: AAA family ATPase [Solirubrobacteraceae bacterium]
MTGRKGLVLIITGPPGSGKTTVADAVAARHGRAAHVESDCFFRFIISGFVEPWKPAAQAQNALVMGVVVEAAAGYANAGYFTIIDGIIISQHFLQTIYDRLQVYGLEVAYVVLGASLGTCLDRSIGRASHPLGDREAVKSLWHRFERQSKPEGHAIETDGLNPWRVADEIVAGLHTRLILSAEKLASAQ